MTKDERRAVVAFRGAATDLINAINRVMKHAAGTEMARRAWDNHDRCDEQFDKAKDALNAILAGTDERTNDK